ncbi:colicin V production protein [Novosphingobium sp. Rr 2-17]|uniref:CvpA family protein n=1 Tax=Novosphingobium sp. Rr 2-17 TaxID=555793 RepID=UPI0002698868|nr:CvpA family protein [Novosphingobium sp. Rr 2-17]EIZ80039.1 colicin V production protein [Novosphingobium sp. Rr 2-17]
MTGFDIAVLLIVGLGAVFGFIRGFVQEILALAAWGFAIFAIRLFHEPLTEWLEPHLGTASGAGVLAFGLLLIVPFAAVKIVARWAGSKSRASVLGPIDRVLGFGFGAVKGMVVIVLGFSLVVLGYDTIWGADGRPDWMKEARTYSFVNASSEALVSILAERRREAAVVHAREDRADDNGA